MYEELKALAIVLGAIIIAVFIELVLVFGFVRFFWDDVGTPVNATVEAPIVNCDCPRPPPCSPGGGIVADGYNVNIVVDGGKWTTPAPLSSDEAGYVTVCRKEDPELIGHPDLNFTKTYKLWHECLDELATARAGYYDQAGQCCVQEDAFELPLPEPIRVPHKMTEAEHREVLRLIEGPDGEKY